MAKTFAITVAVTATLSLQTPGVEEYIRACRSAHEAGALDAFGHKLIGLLDEDKVDEALSLLFKSGLRSGVKDLFEQLNNELSQDAGKLKYAPATVTVTPIVK